MNSDIIVVYQTFTDPINANMVKGLLHSYGIECFLSDENTVTLNAMYSAAVGGVKLNVFEKDIDRINTIIESENIRAVPALANEKDADKVVCPKCNSANASYGGSVKKKSVYGVS